MKELLILAIDTSCDETSVAIVEGLTVLANVLPSQMKYHRKYGGVVPSLAKFAHEERIDNVISEALKKSGKTIDEIDLVAVTVGPGLAIALEVGINKAKELAKRYKKPLMTINHMEGHLYSVLAKAKPSKINNSKLKIENFNSQLSTVKFPLLGFLISGGHTELILVKDFLEYEKTGETLDDSCGEAYDKCGRMLGLGYPAGPVITEFAKQHRKNTKITMIRDSMRDYIKVTNKKSGAEYDLPLAMSRSGDLNMSYSGLKTAVKYLITELSGNEVTLKDELAQDIKGLSKEQILDLCVTFEAAAITQLKIKLEAAIKEHVPNEIWIGGGVVASAKLRSELRNLAKRYSVSLKYPYSEKLTGDNAAMIAVAAAVRIYKLGGIEKLTAQGSKLKAYGLWLGNYEEIDRNPNLDL